VRRLVLVRHGSTAAVRAAAFPRDEPLDERGREEARGLRGALGRVDEAWTSPSVRARETAEAAGLAAVVEPALAECDFGTWCGRALADLAEADPEAVAQWMSRPDAAPHGGESLVELAARVGAWLDGQAHGDGSAVAITHGGVVKAAVVSALGAPLAAFWRIDAAPLGITELHAHEGRWTVARVNERVARIPAEVAP
jgi:broad specificity phosphatase PhoE